MTRRTSRSPALSRPVTTPRSTPRWTRRWVCAPPTKGPGPARAEPAWHGAGGADDVPAHLDALARIANGARPDQVGLEPALLAPAALDIRTYYEEAALALVDHVPAARQAESWLFRSTEAGRVLIAARDALRDAEYPRGVWFAIVPAGQPGP